jgi:hypothetical protein
MERSEVILTTDNEVKAKILELYDELFFHDGYGEIKVCRVD